MMMVRSTCVDQRMTAPISARIHQTMLPNAVLLLHKEVMINKEEVVDGPPPAATAAP